MDPLNRYVLPASGVLIRASFVLFLMLPFLVAVPVSFSQLAVFPPNGFTLKWYGTFFTSQQFASAWKISLLLATLAGAASTVMGTAFALAVTRFHLPGASFMTTLTLSPLIVPGVATGVGLVFFYSFIGLHSGWPRLVLAHIIITSPYVVRVVTATLYNFDRSVEEAGLNLGATEAKVLTTITLPILKPGIIAGFIFAFVASFDNLPATVFVVQAGTETLPVVLLGYIRDQYTPTIAAATVAMVGVAALVMVVIDRVVGVGRAMGLAAQE